jgi:hypothetical protein
MWEGVLQAKKKYDVSLVDTLEFCEYAMSSNFPEADEDQKKEEKKEECKYPEELEPIFGKAAKPIKTTEEMGAAMMKLFWYRVNNGLEDVYQCRRRLDEFVIPEEDYEMCGYETQAVAKDLTTRIMDGQCPVDEDHLEGMVIDVIQTLEKINALRK